MHTPDLFEAFVVPLEQSGIQYFVTGSIAAIVYDEPRLTHDIDIVISIMPMWTAFKRYSVWIAPMEYVILRKLEYFREGGSQKHLIDIQKMLAMSVTRLNRAFLESEIEARALAAYWKQVQLTHLD